MLTVKSQLADFMQRAARVADADGMAVALVSFLGSLGFTGFCYAMLNETGSLDTRKALFSSAIGALRGLRRPGYGTACWPTTYILGNRHVNDPMVGRVQTGWLPLTWRQFDQDRALMPLRREAAQLGVADAVAFPLRGKGTDCEAIAFVYAAEDLREIDHAVPVLQAQIALMAAHARISGLFDRRPRVLGEGVCTQREHEVFQWIAQGLSNAEIGQKLTITERTVNFHIDNVRKKLKARNRMQALAALIFSGEIHSSQ